jgi:hypothetical protein
MTRERLPSGGCRAWVCGPPCLAGVAAVCMQGSVELPSRLRIAAGGDSDLIRVCKNRGKIEPPDWIALPSAMFRAGVGQQKERDGERKTKARQMRKYMVTGESFGKENVHVDVGEDIEKNFAVGKFSQSSQVTRLGRLHERAYLLVCTFCPGDRQSMKWKTQL